MRLRQQWHYVLAVSFVLLGVALAACSGGPQTPLLPTPSTPSPQYQENATNDPVLFIHGIGNDTTKPTSNCDDHNTWGDAKQVLEGTKNSYPIFDQIVAWKPDRLISIGYYASDVNCDVELANPNPPGPTDPNALSNCGIKDVTTVNNDTPIERLSCMVAWYIWDYFSSKGHNVRIVAHSMGGLIIRYILAVTSGKLAVSSQFNNIAFPNHLLLISDVVTFGTPHGGIPAQLYNADKSNIHPFLCPGCFEEDEMRNDNDFMNALASHANSPQGQAGTDWTMIGSDCEITCDNPFENLNTTTYMQGGHKIVYTCGSINAHTVCYGHGSYLTDNNPLLNDQVRICTNCPSNPSRWSYISNMPHSLYYMIYGLLGLEPQHDPHGVVTGHFPFSPPPTQTNCPARGTARTAIMKSMDSTEVGSDPQIVFMTNQQPSGKSITGTLWNYDTVTGSTTSLTPQGPNSFILDAQVSADGQWVLFSSQISGQPELQMVRMDGQGLQTLYCLPATNSANLQNMNTPPSLISDIQWSPDQQSAVFLANKSDANPYPSVFLLNIATGKLQMEFCNCQTQPLLLPYTPLTWLDNTHIYMLQETEDGPPMGLYMLDTNNGTNQQSRMVQNVINGPVSDCEDYANSYDGKTLFTSQCASYSQTEEGYSGPSVIMEQPALGGSPTTIYSSTALRIDSLIVATNTTVLFLIEDVNGDTSHNGLWKINIDGTGLTRLTSDPTASSNFCAFSKYPWANVSRDGSLYTLDNGEENALLFGSLNGGSPTTFATLGNASPINSEFGMHSLAVIGWTTV